MTDPIPFDRGLLTAGAMFGFLGVLAGTFGAHALPQLDEEMLAIYETGARYQMYHALAIVVVACLADRVPGPWFRAGGWLFVGGILVFSGSLYLLAVTGLRWLGAITPIGGGGFVLGWISLALGAIRSKR